MCRSRRSPHHHEAARFQVLQQVRSSDFRHVAVGVVECAFAFMPKCKAERLQDFRLGGRAERWVLCHAGTVARIPEQIKNVIYIRAVSACKIGGRGGGEGAQARDFGAPALA